MASPVNDSPGRARTAVREIAINNFFFSAGAGGAQQFQRFVVRFALRLSATDPVNVGAGFVLTAGNGNITGFLRSGKNPNCCWRILASSTDIAHRELARLLFGLVILAAFWRRRPKISDCGPNSVGVITNRHRIPGD